MAFRRAPMDRQLAIRASATEGVPYSARVVGYTRTFSVDKALALREFLGTSALWRLGIAFVGRSLRTLIAGGLFLLDRLVVIGRHARIVRQIGFALRGGILIQFVGLTVAVWLGHIFVRGGTGGRAA